MEPSNNEYETILISKSMNFNNPTLQHLQANSFFFPGNKDQRFNPLVNND